jgi:hypothetical protein
MVFIKLTTINMTKKNHIKLSIFQIILACFIGCSVVSTDPKSGLEFNSIIADIQNGNLKVLEKHLLAKGNPNFAGGSPKRDLFCTLLHSKEPRNAHIKEEALILLVKHSADIKTRCQPEVANFKKATQQKWWSLASELIRHHYPMEVEDLQELVVAIFDQRASPSFETLKAYLENLPPERRLLAGEILWSAVSHMALKIVKLYSLFPNDLDILDYVKNNFTPYTLATALADDEPQHAATYDEIKGLLILFGAKGVPKTNALPSFIGRPDNWTTKLDPALFGKYRNEIWGKLPLSNIDWGPSGTVPSHGSVAFDEACKQLKHTYRAKKRALQATHPDTACSHSNLPPGVVFDQKAHDYCLAVAAHRAQFITQCYQP